MRIEDIPVAGQGRRPPARFSHDGTVRYCLCCSLRILETDTPEGQIGRRRIFCKACGKARDDFTKSNKAKAYLVEKETIAAMYDLLDAVGALEQRLGRATVEFRREETPPKWVDDLMLASKDVMRIVYDEIRPAFRLEKRPDVDPEPSHEQS